MSFLTFKCDSLKFACKITSECIASNVVGAAMQVSNHDI